MRRVAVVGITGAGKTTLARRLAARHGLAFLEMDATWHGPGWTRKSGHEGEVGDALSGSGWVTDSVGYEPTRALLWARLDTVVWLDLPRRQVMFRVVRRSFVRASLRRELWNGNRESFRGWVRPDHPVRWAWSQHAERRRQVAELLDGHPSVVCVALRSASEARRWARRHVRAGAVPAARQVQSAGATVGGGSS